jgi:hypothetical protein
MWTRPTTRIGRENIAVFSALPDVTLTTCRPVPKFQNLLSASRPNTRRSTAVSARELTRERLILCDHSACVMSQNVFLRGTVCRNRGPSSCPRCSAVRFHQTLDRKQYFSPGFPPKRIHDRELHRHNFAPGIVRNWITSISQNYSFQQGTAAQGEQVVKVMVPALPCLDCVTARSGSGHRTRASTATRPSPWGHR